jgi:hypothetical protein
MKKSSDFHLFDDYFSARKFWGTFTTHNAIIALPPTVPRLPITGGALPQPQLNQFPAITAALFRFREQLSPITHFTQKDQKRRIFLF